MTHTPTGAEAAALLDRLLAERTVARLHATYAQLCDIGYPSDDIAALFTDDGIWESSPGTGTITGRENIRRHFTGADRDYPWAMHINVPLHIDVSDDGHRAHGAWYLLMPCIDATAPGENATGVGGWLAGRYDNDFVKDDDGQWKYQHLRVRFALMSPHLADWSRDRYGLLNARATTHNLVSSLPTDTDRRA